MSTNLLKRAEPLLSSNLVSIILLLNAQLLDANASAFNPRGVRNEDSLPVPESNFTRGTTPEAKQLDTAYFKLWNLLGSMHDPRLLLRCPPPVNDDSTPKVRESIKSMLSAMEEVTLEFSRVAKEAKEHMRNPAKEKLLEPVSRNFFCPKYLTSRELFDAQIKDSLFRRQVLVHFLLKCEVLLFYCDHRVKHYETIISLLGKKGRRNKFILPERSDKIVKDEVRGWVTADEEKEIKSIRSRIIIVLSRIPPRGSEFVEAIIQLLREEASWMWWKTRFLQPLFDLPRLDVPELSDYVSPPSPMPTDTTGITRLDSMWDSLAVKIKDQLPEVDLNDWVKDLEDEVRGDIDREYQKSRKEQWKWQTYRLYLRHHFSTMTAPTTSHPIRDVRRRALGEPDLTVEEINEIRVQEREAELMRHAILEERRLAAEREEQERRRRDEEEIERRRKIQEEREKQRLAATELKRQQEEEQRHAEAVINVNDMDNKVVKDSKYRQQRHTEVELSNNSSEVDKFARESKYRSQRQQSSGSKADGYMEMDKSSSHEDRISHSRESSNVRSHSPTRESIQTDSDRSRLRGRGSTRILSRPTATTTNTSTSTSTTAIGAGSNLFRRLAEGRSASDIVVSSGNNYDERRSSSSQGNRYDRDLDDRNSVRKRSRGGFDEYRPESSSDHRYNKRHRG